MVSYPVNHRNTFHSVRFVSHLSFWEMTVIRLQEPYHYSSYDSNVVFTDEELKFSVWLRNFAIIEAFLTDIHIFCSKILLNGMVVLKEPAWKFRESSSSKRTSIRRLKFHQARRTAAQQG